MTLGDGTVGREGRRRGHREGDAALAAGGRLRQVRELGRAPQSLL